MPIVLQKKAAAFGSFTGIEEIGMISIVAAFPGGSEDCWAVVTWRSHRGHG